MTETICWIQHKKIIEEDKNSHNDRKAFNKLRNNLVYGKKMESLRNRNGVRLVSNKKIFDNYLVVIRKTKFH